MHKRNLHTFFYIMFELYFYQIGLYQIKIMTKQLIPQSSFIIRFTQLERKFFILKVIFFLEFVVVLIRIGLVYI